ncbi:MAG: dephospho-CoA kinase [Shinella sp.]|nr:dephospho-CoA kinase [Shinella sp.]
MIIVGLTGSIGTGKSTTAGMFRDMGIPVHDADAVVHDLYRGEAALAVAAAFPGVLHDGAIDRKLLSATLADDPAGFKRLEAIIHPLVRRKEQEFLSRQRAAGVPIVVLDIPLLFETGGEKRVDTIVVVSCDPEIQRQRVLSRPEMTEEKFQLLLSRQIPDREKRDRADFVVDSGKGLEDAREQVKEIVRTIAKAKG